MFTGAAPADLLREAEQRAKAALAPGTFLGRKGDAQLPRHVAAALPRVARAPPDALLSWLEQSLLRCKGERVDGKCSSSTGDDEEALGCVLTIVQCAVRERVGRKQIRGDLEALGVPPATAEAFAERIHSERWACEASAEAGKPGPPHLEALRWRVDAVVSAREQVPFAQAQVGIEMELSDGSLESFQASAKALERMRYCVAKALAEMVDLEGHPMMRIMAVLEAEENRNLAT